MKSLLRFTSWLLIIFTIIGILFVYEKLKSFFKETYHEIKQKTQRFERSGYFHFQQLNSIEQMMEVLHKELDES